MSGSPFFQSLPFVPAKASDPNPYDTIDNPTPFVQGRPAVPGAAVQSPWDLEWQLADAEPQPQVSSPQPGASESGTSREQTGGTDFTRFIQGMIDPIMAGAGEAQKDFTQTSKLLWDKPYERPAPANPQLTEMPTIKGAIANPALAGQQAIAQATRMFPAAIGAIVGAGAVAAAAPAEAAVGGIAFAGAAGGTMLATLGQQLGINFDEAHKANPTDPEKAWREAVTATTADTAFAGAGALLLGANPFSTAMKNMLFQTFLVQPAAGVAGMRAHEAATGRDSGLTLGDEYLNMVLPGAIMGAAGEGVHSIARTAGEAPWSLPWRGEGEEFHIDPEVERAIAEVGGDRHPAEEFGAKMQRVQNPVDAWHGSPHDFDQFSMDKLGTGEGAEVYGHGLYFAEHPDVAKSYREGLTKQGVSVEYQGKPIEARPFAREQTYEGTPQAALESVQAYGSVDRAIGEIEKGLRSIESRGGRFPDNDFVKAQKQRLEFLRANRDDIAVKQHGATFNVDLHVQPHETLDWDQPLASQPDVEAKLHAAGIKTTQDLKWGGRQKPSGGPTYWMNNGTFIRESPRGFEYGIGSPWDGEAKGTAPTLEEAKAAAPVSPRSLTGQQLMHNLKMEKVGYGPTYGPEVSKALRNAGVRAIKFLDQGSRDSATAKPTRNYVMLHDEDIAIKAKMQRSRGLGSKLEDLIPKATEERTAAAFDRQFPGQKPFQPTDIRPSKENLSTVAKANFDGNVKITDRTRPTDELTGGVRMTDPKERARVQKLADQMKSPDGYVERVVVDNKGNVIEGQHRLEALRMLGAKDVPVTEMHDATAGLPVSQMKEAISKAAPTHSDHITQIVSQIGDHLHEVGSVARIREEFDPPRGFEKQWNAALDAVEKQGVKFQRDRAPAEEGGAYERVTPSKISLSKQERIQHGALLRDIKRFVETAAPGLKILPVRELHEELASGRKVRQNAAYFPESAVGPLMVLALEGPDGFNARIAGSARHEIIHYLKPIFKTAEWQALEDAAISQGWLKKHDIDRRYPKLDQAGKLEEAIADEYGLSFGNNFTSYPPLVRRALTKLKSLLGNIKTAIQKRLGKDVTARELMSKVESGEMGWRRPGERAGGIPQFQRAEHPDTPAFRRWFGASKVVDESGAPRVVYHGTNQDIAHFADDRRGGVTNSVSSLQGHFFTSDPSLASEYADMAARHLPSDIAEYERKEAEYQREIPRLEAKAKRTGRPQDWTDYEDALSAWESLEAEALRGAPTGQNLVPAYLSLKNPLEVHDGDALKMHEKIEQAKAAGHDGVIFHQIVDGPTFMGDKASDIFVAFDSGQIKSAVGNRGTFNPRDKRIAFQRGKADKHPLARVFREHGDWQPLEFRGEVQEGENHTQAADRVAADALTRHPGAVRANAYSLMPGETEKNLLSGEPRKFGVRMYVKTKSLPEDQRRTIPGKWQRGRADHDAELRQHVDADPDLGSAIKNLRGERLSLKPGMLESVPALKAIIPYLSPAEVEKTNAKGAQAIVDMFRATPHQDEIAAVAISGRGKRGWYEKSARTIMNVFGEKDAPRFSALLAALSPQCSVETNAYNALRMWMNWDKAGRPTNPKRILKIAGDSVQGSRGIDSVLGAWRPNMITALTEKSPHDIVLSGNKVDSFMRNLNDVVHAVTNDAWMANYGGVNQDSFRGPGYHGFSAKARTAADVAKKLTGRPWTPREIQETVWSWAKTLYELRDQAGENRTMKQLLKAGAVTHRMIAETPDFGTLFTEGVYRNILEQGGYGKQIGKLDAGKPGARANAAPNEKSVYGAEGTGFARGTFEKHLDTAADRLEQLRRDRRLDAGIKFQRAPIDTPAFKSWFGGSKAVDRKGAPKLLWHGSETGGDFSEFKSTTHDLNVEGKPFKFNTFYFSDKKSVASTYADDTDIAMGFDQAVMPVYLSMKNPKVFDLKGKTWWDNSPFYDIAKAAAEGHDGAIVKNIRDEAEGGGERSNVYVVFDPKQIKHADNAGTWSKDTADIYMQRGRAEKRAPVVEYRSLAGVAPSRRRHDQTPAAAAYLRGPLPL